MLAAIRLNLMYINLPGIAQILRHYSASAASDPASRTGPSAILPRFSVANTLWIIIPNAARSTNECIYLRRQLVPKGSEINVPQAGACQYYTKTPSINSLLRNKNSSIFEGDFAYLNFLTPAQYATYVANSDKIYTSHKNDKYREVVTSELVPIIALVDQWILEINSIDAPGVSNVPALPSFTAITETQ